MRKILITIILFGAIINSKSELQHFFPDSNACFSVSWMKFWFEGDTIIENLKYKKVYWQWNDSIADFSKAQYFAAIREDTIAEKVYFVPANLDNPQQGTDEYLLYDFAVDVGETINFYTFWPDIWYLREETHVVESIDSILIDNQYRKKINFIGKLYYMPEAWIEGIGSTHGLFFAGEFDCEDTWLGFTELICIHFQGIVIYQLYDYCYIAQSQGTINKSKSNSLKIYPTITDDFLYFETEEYMPYLDYKIINLQGQTVVDGKLTSEIINVSTLSKGFYLLLILDNNKNIYRQKFVKR